MNARAATLVDFVPARDGDEAGLSVYMNPDHRYEIAVGRLNGRRRVFLRQRVGAHLEAVTASHPVDESNPIELRVEATPEEYVFSFGAAPAAGDGASAVRELGRAAVRYLSSEVAGGFTGVYFGLYATGDGTAAVAPAHFDWFDYQPVAP
jgi:alpha-N-arabinofuranosidase